MSQLSSLWNLRLRGEINMADADSVTYTNGSIPGSALQGGADVLRSQLALNDLDPYPVALDTWRVTGTGALLGTAAGTPSGAFGITVGTHGTASPKLVGESASGNSKTNSCRKLVYMDARYDDGETVTIRVHARITANCNTAQTLDVEAYAGDKEAGVGSDLVTTSAQTLTTSWADYDYTVTVTGLSAGDPLDVEITGVANDTGGTAGAVIEIGDIRILADTR